MKSLWIATMLMAAPAAFAQDFWERQPDLDSDVFDGLGMGGSLAATGPDEIYLLHGWSSRSMSRYTPSTGTWTRIPSANETLPDWVGLGGGLAWNESTGRMYVMVGHGNSDFFEYAPATDTWQALAPYPFPEEDGTTMACAQGRIFAIGGTDRNGGIPMKSSLYEFSGGSWATLSAFPPFQVGSGARLCWAGGDHLYLAIGGSTDEFARYSIAEGTWESLPHLDDYVAASSALAAGSDGFLYCIPNMSTGHFWRYDIAKGEWGQVAPSFGDDPYSMPGHGVSLAWAAASQRMVAVQGGGTGVWHYRPGDLPPDAPTLMKQMRADHTIIAEGGYTLESGFVVSASIADVNGDPIRLEVECKPVGVGFDGTGMVPSATVAGSGTAEVTLALAENTAFHWRALTRSMGAVQAASAWAVFGSNGDPDGIDLRQRSNAAPTLGAFGQRGATDGAPIAVGGRLLDPAGIRFVATAVDGDGDRYCVQVEVRAIGEAWTGEPTRVGAFAPSGGEASVVCSPAPGGYRWRIRVADEHGRTGDWADFGANTDGEADFSLIAFGSAGVRSCLASSTGSGLGALGLLALLATLKIRRPALAMLLLACLPASADENPVIPRMTVYVDPPYLHDPAAVRGTFVYFTVAASDLPEVNAGTLSVDFDPAVLVFAGAEPGTFFTGISGNPLLLSMGNPAGGHYWAMLVRDGFCSGSCTLFTIRFWVASVGETRITLGPGDDVAATESTPIFVTSSDPDWMNLHGIAPEKVSAGYFSNLPALPDPSALVQSATPGGAPEPSGFADRDGLVSFRTTLAALPFAAGFQVEVVEWGGEFSGTVYLQADVSAGSTSVEVTSAALPPGDYHWRARIFAGADGASDWVEFNGAGADFHVQGAGEGSTRPPSAGRGRTSGPLCGSTGGAGGLSLLAAVLAGLLAARRTR